MPVRIDQPVFHGLIPSAPHLWQVRLTDAVVLASQGVYTYVAAIDHRLNGGVDDRMAHVPHFPRPTKSHLMSCSTTLSQYVVDDSLAPFGKDTVASARS